MKMSFQFWFGTKLMLTALAVGWLLQAATPSLQGSVMGVFQSALSGHAGAASSPASLAPSAPPAASGSATATKWVENPIAIKVGISGWVIAESNSTVTIVLGNVTNTITGLGTNDATNVIPFFVNYKTAASLEARVEGSQIKEAYFEFIKPARTDLSVGSRNRGKEPKGYRIYVDNEEKLSVNEVHTNGLGAMNKSWKVLIKAEIKAGPGGTVEDIPEGVAPGDGGWPLLGPGNSEMASVAGIKWEVPLGRMRNGKSASAIRLTELGLSADSYTPWQLIYESPVTNLVLRYFPWL